MDPTILESCHSTWIFDAERLRFRRIIKDIKVGDRVVTTQWRSYSSLHLDPEGETFTVFLNDLGTRMIRSWRHTLGCQQCALHGTRELSLQEIRDAVSA